MDDSVSASFEAGSVKIDLQTKWLHIDIRFVFSIVTYYEMLGNSEKLVLIKLIKINMYCPFGTIQIAFMLKLHFMITIRGPIHGTRHLQSIESF